MPGLAVAEVLRERGWRVLWLGNPDKMESNWFPCASRACAGAAPPRC
ncbi:undecaprenyldiphospho-muramoylpentapeptide beta-N-acetylglucosaminyltransferase [Bordetella pertussis]|nr:undecaprenyldiphospho-muramoylpentapeptide beta-N-acetylglucosaminyltransferase [Bordetella pertussis]